MPAEGAANRGRQGGFTAIELVVVLIVLVIAAAAVLPGLPAFTRGQHVRAAADKLAAVMRNAVNASGSHQRTLVLTFDRDARRFTLDTAQEDDPTLALAQPLLDSVQSSTPAGATLGPGTGSGLGAGSTGTASTSTSTNAGSAPDGPVVLDDAWRTVPLPADVDLELADAADGQPLDQNGRIRFFPDGTTDDATITLASGQMRFTVRLDGRRGRVTVGQGNAEDTAPGATTTMR